MIYGRTTSGFLAVLLSSLLLLCIEGNMFQSNPVRSSGTPPQTTPSLRSSFFGGGGGALAPPPNDFFGGGWGALAPPPNDTHESATTAVLVDGSTELLEMREGIKVLGPIVLLPPSRVSPMHTVFLHAITRCQ
jgi:hypothetical protein